METTAPDFSTLTERLLAPHRTIELHPIELLREKNTVRLIPARNGKCMVVSFLDTQSLPTLNLAEAEIDSDRTQEIIFLECKKFLYGQKFSILPCLDIIQALAALPDMKDLLDSKSAQIELQNSRWFLRPQGYDSEKESQKFFDKLSRDSFYITPEKGFGAEINLTRSVRGFLLETLSFMLSLENLNEESPEWKAAKAATSYRMMADAVLKLESNYAEYVRRKDAGWFPWINTKGSRAALIAEANKELAARAAIANEKLSALPVPA